MRRFLYDKWSIAIVPHPRSGATEHFELTSQGRIVLQPYLRKDKFLDESCISEACYVDSIVLVRVPRYKDPGHGIFQRRGTPIIQSPIAIRLGRGGGGWRLNEFISLVAAQGQMDDKLR